MARRRDIDRLQEEIEELFADLWRVPRFSGMRRAFRPQVDCFKTEDAGGLTVVVELSGVDPDDVRIVALDDELVIAGERRRPKGERVTYYQMEIEYGPFQRRIALPDGVDTAAATATYERGVLTISLPLVEKPKRREKVSIPVRGRV